MKPIAVLGASGFVGSRLMEMHHLGGGAPLRPIFYRAASMGLLARFHYDSRIADYHNPDALARALEGCDTLVHLAVSGPDTIRALTTPIYEAAARAGVRRMVFMSSAAVHGQTPAQGTTETTPPPRHQAFAYNTAKADAENLLRTARARGSVELVILRPCIIWGPRSRWIVSPVRAIREGTFGWLNDGQGIINPIYVDNLVHAIDCACTAPVDGETFLLNDPAPTTWREFFTPWLEACGSTPEKVAAARPYARQTGLLPRIDRLKRNPTAYNLANKLPGIVKRSLSAMVNSLPEPAPYNPFGGLVTPPGPIRLTEEMTLLESCAWRFPTEHAQAKLGWQSLVDWPTAVQSSLGWLRFADFLPDEGA